MSKIRLNKDHLKDIDYKVTVPMIQCSECGQSVLDTPTNRANNLIHDAMCSKNPTPQPLGMSGEEKWWEELPYKKIVTIGENADEVPIYDTPAILKEHRRLVLEECREVVKKHSTENAHILTPAPSTCLKILSRLDSLMKSDSPEEN